MDSTSDFNQSIERARDKLVIQPEKRVTVVFMTNSEGLKAVLYCLLCDSAFKWTFPTGRYTCSDCGADVTSREASIFLDMCSSSLKELYPAGTLSSGKGGLKWLWHRLFKLRNKKPQSGNL